MLDRSYHSRPSRLPPIDQLTLYFISETKKNESDFDDFENISQVQKTKRKVIGYLCTVYLKLWANIFAELYNPWKDGCLAFTEEMIQVTKYYRESLDSRPVEKCKVREREISWTTNELVLLKAEHNKLTNGFNLDPSQLSTNRLN